MNTFFKKLSVGEQAVSNEHGLVDVVSTEVRNGTKFVECETIPTGAQSEDESLSFEAIEGELSCPVECQINSAIGACEARIDNGADIEDSFKWLKSEVQKAYKGEFTYDFD
jgi:hypothetical protein